MEFEYMKDFSVKFLYLVVGTLAGFLLAFHDLTNRLEYAKLQRQIDSVKEKRAYVCEAKGTRMECISYILEDDVGI
jgi:hypothetical protein